MSFENERESMVKRQLAGRDITSPAVLAAFERVPREEFLPEGLREFAYRDTPLPIAEGQTISQPYIVALTMQALELEGGERILEVGTGSGYAAALLGEIGEEVFTIERHGALAEAAEGRLRRLGYGNVHVRHGDGTVGWSENGPYDAIAVAAGGPRIPPALLEQLAEGGRLVIPVGETEEGQVLTRVERRGGELYEQPITDVRFVPLVGEQGWEETPKIPVAKPSAEGTVAKLVREEAQPIDDLESANVDTLIERMSDKKVVLIGEATHGTSEFYRFRARLTKELIERAGFDFVAVEADWPDAARIDTYVLGDDPRVSSDRFTPFQRFPTWMWRNEEVAEFVEWLRARNLERPDRGQRVGFHGLDLYSMFTSIAVVLSYLDDVDPAAAAVARTRYGRLTPFEQDPAAYGRAVLVGRYASSEESVVSMLRDLLSRRLEYAEKDGERYFDAAQNAKVVANAERYYRAMYYGSAASWNLRDSHMFDTLEALCAFYGPGSKGIVWEHNSHVGDARATEMGVRGELNVGQLARETFGPDVHIVGFGTDRGTVAAASDWDGPMERKAVRPSHPESYEHLFHRVGIPAFALHLRDPRRAEIRAELEAPRLERAIGVIYRPETERASHYFHATLPHQFDEMIFIDETRAVTPLPAPTRRSTDLPDTYPFGL